MNLHITSVTCKGSKQNLKKKKKKKKKQALCKQVRL